MSLKKSALHPETLRPICDADFYALSLYMYNVDIHGFRRELPAWGPLPLRKARLPPLHAFAARLW